MSNSGIPAPATLPVPPPLARLPFCLDKNGNGLLLTTPAYSFLQALWAAAFGSGGIVDLESWILNAIQAPPFEYSSPEKQTLPSQVASLAIPSQLYNSRQYYTPFIPEDVVKPSGKTLFSQTQFVTVGNTITETPLNGTGFGSLTLPAKSLSPGTTIKFWAMGYHSASGNPNITVQLKLGTTAILTTGAVASSNGTNNLWEFRGMITVATDGASGTLNAQGFYEETGGGANLFGMVNTATVSFDTTAAAAITLTVTWGTASVSNTITCSNFVVESEKP